MARATKARRYPWIWGGREDRDSAHPEAPFALPGVASQVLGLLGGWRRASSLQATDDGEDVVFEACPTEEASVREPSIQPIPCRRQVEATRSGEDSPPVLRAPLEEGRRRRAPREPFI